MRDTVKSIAASLIRQHVFCPRIPFYNEVMGVNPSNRLWQQQGVSFHERQTMLLKRRNLKQFGLQQPVLKHNLHLRSEVFCLHGVCDAILFTEREACPLEFKLGSLKSPRRGHILQLAAYALMTQEQFGINCNQLFILYGPRGHTYRVSFDSTVRADVLRVVEEIRDNLGKPLLPNSSASDKQCGQCEYLNFCADREC